MKGSIRQRGGTHTALPGPQPLLNSRERGGHQEVTDMERTTITAEEARVLTDAIKSALVATWNLREQAYRARAWVPLGYSSWEDYCQAEFSTVAIPRPQRPAVVAAMRSAGMSTRAIAAATGLGLGTVHRELSGVPNGTPDVITGADGKKYRPQRAAEEVPSDPVFATIHHVIPMLEKASAAADLLAERGRREDALSAYQQVAEVALKAQNLAAQRKLQYERAAGQLLGEGDR